jgi:hypothetical protein
MKFWVPYCDVRYYFPTETMFSSSLPPVCVGELMSYLRYLCLFAQSGVQYILCCVFDLFFFVLLPVSLDCPFLLVLSVFSSVYIKQCDSCIIPVVFVLDETWVKSTILAQHIDKLYSTSIRYIYSHNSNTTTSSGTTRYRNRA